MAENQPNQQPETEAQRAERLNKEYQEQQAAELRKRKDLGHQGRLRCAECWYYDADGVLRNNRMVNLTGREVLEMRERLFSAGLMVPIDPGRWRVIAPQDIKTIEIFKQSKFFDV